jgi:HlyD family secretion protein
MRVKRAALVAGVAVVAAGGLFLALRPGELAVQVEVVARGPLRVTVDEDGETRVRDRFRVAAPVEGHLRRLAVREGDSVRAGEAVAWLEPTPLDPRARETAERRVEAAEDGRAAAGSALASAEAALAQEGADLRRADTLLAHGALSREAWERQRLAVETSARAAEAAGARSRAAAHEVEVARAALISATGGGPLVPLRAPAAGRVLRVLEQSERVMPAGTPVLEIGDDSALEVVLDVLTQDAVRIRIGAPVLLSVTGGGDTLAARVRSVEPAAFTKVSPLGVEEQRVNVVVDIEGPAAGLGDGFRVDARIVVWEGADLLLVPSGALVREPEGWTVFTVREGRARRVPVRIGERGGTAAEVREGLREGDRVIVWPDDRVRDGERVRDVQAL